MGYSEIQHAADWALYVWGSTIEELFSEAARGMYNLMSVEKEELDNKTLTSFQSPVGDKETQLVAFLQELINSLEEENMIYDQFEFQFSPGNCRVKMYGHIVKSLGKLIKAVTFHNLAIHHEQAGFNVEIVFDV